MTVEMEAPMTYAQLLELGNQRLRTDLDAAREHSRLKQSCNGRKDCTSKYHLACCARR